MVPHLFMPLCLSMAGAATAHSDWKSVLTEQSLTWPERHEADTSSSRATVKITVQSQSYTLVAIKPRKGFTNEYGV